MSSLQKKYNDFMDSGGHAVTFYAKNELLDDKHEKARQELKKNYQALEKKREKDPKERLKIIRKRLENYHEHTNDSYAYYQTEINEVRTLLQHASADIEFLLKEIEQLQKKRKNLWMELRAANNRLRKKRQ